VNKAVIIIAMLLLMPMLNGCIAPQIGKIKEFFTPPQKYEWVKKVDEKGEFGILDIINSNLAKVDYFPFMIENGTKFLHVYIKVNFSKPAGFLNITIVSPHKNYTKEYSTIAKSFKYDDFFYFDNPEEGNWKIVVKFTGIGKYTLVAEAYQKI